MNYFALGLLLVIASMCIFAILDRLCTCFERCAQSRAFGKYIENTVEDSNRD